MSAHLFPVSMTRQAQFLQTVTLATTASSTLEHGHTVVLPAVQHRTSSLASVLINLPSPRFFSFRVHQKKREEAYPT